MINMTDITYFFFKCRVKLKHPVSANYETETHQSFSIVSLPTDSVIVDHAVLQCTTTKFHFLQSLKILVWKCINIVGKSEMHNMLFSISHDN
jgi:hypothetical protein